MGSGTPSTLRSRENDHMGTWNRAKSEQRIRKLLERVPRPSSVRRYDPTEFTIRKSTLASRPSTDNPIFHIGPSEAIVVDGAHVYVQLVDFSESMQNLAMETVAGHKRLLQMQHLHYAACDSVAAEFGVQRVDFHGPRMHVVVVEPAGSGNEAERIRIGLQFANAVSRVIAELSLSVGNGNFGTKVRIGIDTGLAIATNSGRGAESEPLFLGTPANHAAKLADGTEPGIYVSDRVRSVLGKGELGGLWAEKRTRFDPGSVQFGSRSSVADTPLVQRAVQNVHTRSIPGGFLPDFQFHHHEPPMRTLRFEEVSPSNAVRMEMLSVFADVSGFTSYVDECIRSDRIAEMVQNFHVLRGELAACFRDDFDGRKVRFIGDCLHGIIAEGDSSSVNRAGSVHAAVAAAAGLRSSFELSQAVLPGLNSMGIAIGLELGVTPVARIGIRGDRSVRCCVSKAVSVSEALQSESDGNQTKLGERAYDAAPGVIQRLFGRTRTAEGLDFDAFERHTRPPARVTSGSVSREVRPYTR